MMNERFEKQEAVERAPVAIFDSLSLLKEGHLGRKAAAAALRHVDSDSTKNADPREAYKEPSKDKCDSSMERTTPADVYTTGTVCSNGIGIDFWKADPKAPVKEITNDQVREMLKHSKPINETPVVPMPNSGKALINPREVSAEPIMHTQPGIDKVASSLPDDHYKDLEARDKGGDKLNDVNYATLIGRRQFPDDSHYSDLPDASNCIRWARKMICLISKREICIQNGNFRMTNVMRI